MMRRASSSLMPMLSPLSRAVLACWWTAAAVEQTTATPGQPRAAPIGAKEPTRQVTLRQECEEAWNGLQATERVSRRPRTSSSRSPSARLRRSRRVRGGRRRPPHRTGSARARASGAAEGSLQRFACAISRERTGDPAWLIVAPSSSSPLDGRGLLGDGAHELAGALVAVVIAQLGIVVLEDFAAYPLALDDSRELVHAVSALSGLSDEALSAARDDDLARRAFLRLPSGRRCCRQERGTQVDSHPFHLLSTVGVGLSI